MLGTAAVAHGRWLVRGEATFQQPVMLIVQLHYAFNRQRLCATPCCRWETPLSDSVAQALQKLYRQGPGMGDLLERARHRIEEGATGHHTDHGKSLCRKR